MVTFSLTLLCNSFNSILYGAMGAGQSVVSTQSIQATAAPAAVPQSQPLATLRSRFASLADFDFSGAGLSESDYQEKLKDVVEIADNLLTQMSQDEMTTIMRETYSALGKCQVSRYFWTDSSSILGRVPENFRRKVIQIAEACGHGPDAKAALKTQMPVSLKSVKQGGYLGHTLVMNVLGYRGPDGAYTDPLTMHVHPSMQMVPATNVKPSALPLKAPEHTHSPGFSGNILQQAGIPQPTAWPSQAAGLPSSPMAQFLTEGAASLQQEQKTKQIYDELANNLRSLPQSVQNAISDEVLVDASKMVVKLGLQSLDLVKLLDSYTLNDESRLGVMNTIQRTCVSQGVVLGSADYNRVLETFFTLAQAMMGVAQRTPGRQSHTSLDAAMGFRPSTTTALNEQRIAGQLIMTGSVAPGVVQEEPMTSHPGDSPALTPAQKMFAVPGTGARLIRPPSQPLKRGGIGHPSAGYFPAMSSATMAIEASRGTIPHVPGPAPTSDVMTASAAATKSLLQSMTAFHSDRSEDPQQAIQNVLAAGTKGVVSSSTRLPSTYKESRKRKVDDDAASQVSTDGGGVAHYGRKAAIHRFVKTSGKVQPGTMFNAEALEALPQHSTLSLELLEGLVAHDPNAIQILINLQTNIAREKDTMRKANLLQAIRQFSTKHAQRLLAWIFCPTSASHSRMYGDTALRHLLYLVTPPRPGGVFPLTPDWANQAALQHIVATYEQSGVLFQHPDQQEMYDALDTTYVEHLFTRRSFSATFVGQDLASVTLLLSACTPQDGDVLDAILGMNASTAHAIGGLARAIHVVSSLSTVQKRYIDTLGVDITEEYSMWLSKKKISSVMAVLHGLANRVL